MLMYITLYYYIIIFFFFCLDTGFHCHPVRVHVRVGIWGLVYVVEAGGVATIIIIPASPDACPTGVGNRDTCLLYTSPSPRD